MAEAPNAWDMILERLNRLEDKVDKVGERVVPRDEFERYKVSNAAEIASIRADAKEQQKVLDAAEKSERDEKNRMLMWGAGMVLTPLISAFVAWAASGGLGGAS